MIPIDIKGFPGASVVKNPPTDAGDRSSIQELAQEDPLEKEMATYPSILTWEIPWKKEPGRQQSMELQSQTQLSNWTHMNEPTDVDLEPQLYARS